MAVDQYLLSALYGQGGANPLTAMNNLGPMLQGAMGQIAQQNAANQQQNFANNYADAQFGAYKYGLDQNNAYQNKQLDAQTAYLNSALQGNLGLSGQALTSRTGLENRGLDLQGNLGGRQLDILAQEQANKLSVANSRNDILKSLLGGFGNWFGGGQQGAPATGQAPAGAPIGGSSAPLGGAPTFSPGQYQSKPAGFTTNYGQSATYTPGQRGGGMPPQGAPATPPAAPPTAPPVTPPAPPPTGGMPPPQTPQTSAAAVSALPPHIQALLQSLQQRGGGMRYTR